MKCTDRVQRFLDQPEVRRQPARVISRRAAFHVLRRVAPGALARDRVCELIDGGRLWARLSDEIERSVFLLGVYDFQAAAAFLELMRRGDTVLDVGAHVGQFSVLAGRRVGPKGRVVAFEPQPGLADRLRRNLALNQLANVEVQVSAVSSQPADGALFHPSDRRPNSGLGNLCRQADCQDEHASVPVTTLDASLRDHAVHVVKIDVEGCEREVLAGAASLIARHHPSILFEANEPVELAGRVTGAARTAPVIALLEKWDYEVHAIVNRDRDIELVPLAAVDLPSIRIVGRPLSLAAVHPSRRLGSRR